jgi:membrane protease YdiL (CAAX protease family)
MYWEFALILVVLGVAVPWLGRHRIQQLMQAPQTSKLDRLVLYASTVAFQWAAAGAVLWRTNAHGIHASQLGLAIPRTSLTLAVSVVLSLFVLAHQVFSLRRLASRPPEMNGVLPQMALKVFPQDDVERLAFFALVATVAVCEELIYRGFVQLVFERWLGGFVVAGVVGSAVFFSLAHLYQGRRGMATTLAVGLLFAAIRAWTGSLGAPLVAHFVADLVVGLMAPGRLRVALALADKDGELSQKTSKAALRRI